MPFQMALTRRAVQLATFSLPAMIIMTLAACQTTTEPTGGSLPTTAAPAVQTVADATMTKGAYQEKRALKAGFTQVTGRDLHTLIAGHSYAYEHPRGARITVSYSTDGHTFGTWTHPSGMKGKFQETWAIRNGGNLCANGDEGTKCDRIYRKGDLLVRIHDSGQVDRLIPMPSTATK